MTVAVLRRSFILLVSSYVLQETLDLGDDEMQPSKPPPIWRRKFVSEICIPVCACAGLLTAAILVRIHHRHIVRFSARFH